MTTYSLSRSIYTASPTTGTTYTVPAQDSGDMLIKLTPSSSLAALGINLPSDNDSVDGQTLRFWCTQNITTLTWDSGKTVDNAANTFLANSFIQVTHVGSNHWVGDQ